MIFPGSLLSILLSLTGTWALQCYHFERSFNGSFDLSGIHMPIITCGVGQKACLEAVTSISTGYRSSVTLVKKGCTYEVGKTTIREDSLPSDYTQVLRCPEDLCNHQIENQESIPNLSPAPDTPVLSGTECWACVSTTAEGCDLKNSRKVKCYGDQSFCFLGKGFLAIENFSTQIFVRTCHQPRCTQIGATTQLSKNFIKGTCCEGNLCNSNVDTFAPEVYGLNEDCNCPKCNCTNAAPSEHPPVLMALPLLLTTPLWLRI